MTLTQRQRAGLRMFSLADFPSRFTDPVGHADRRTSMADARTALSIAIGVPLDQIDPSSGHAPAGWSCPHTTIAGVGYNNAVGRPYQVCICGYQQWSDEA